MDEGPAAAEDEAGVGRRVSLLGVEEGCLRLLGVATGSGEKTSRGLGVLELRRSTGIGWMS